VNEEIIGKTSLPGSEVKNADFTGENTSNNNERIYAQASSIEDNYERIKSANQLKKQMLSHPVKKVDRMLVSMTLMGNEINEIRNLIPADSSNIRPREDSILTNSGLYT
jgi:hypothetical protein